MKKQKISLIKNPISKFFLYQRHNAVRYYIRNIHSNILDVGCGLYKIRKDAVGLEVKKHKVRYLNRTGQGINVCGSVLQIPFPDDHFDCVVMLEVLEHMDIQKQHAALREVARVLKPDGLFVMSMPNMDKFFSIPYRIIWHIWERTVMQEYFGEHVGLLPVEYIERLLGMHFNFFFFSKRVALLDRIFVCIKRRSQE